MPATARGKSLARYSPEVAQQWHEVKNGSLRPEHVARGSDRKVWWRCGRDPSHEWEASILSRTQGAGCPYCSGHRVTAATSLAARRPELAALWHPHNNGRLTPADVTAKSGRTVWWRCTASPAHEWRGPVAVLSSRCPYCPRYNGPRRKGGSLAALYPKLTREWHPTKNRPHDPARVAPGSDYKAWWRCAKNPEHEWQTAVKRRTYQKSGCPFCAGHRAASDTSLAALYPALAREWNVVRNGLLKPTQIRPGSDRKVWWRCRRNVRHEWLATVLSRARAGRGCPYCTSQRASPDRSLGALYPKIAREWHPKKNLPLTPYDVTPGSGKRIVWHCAVKRWHEWEAAVYMRTGASGGGCPHCRREVRVRRRRRRAPDG